MGRNPAFDGIRAFAAVLVLLHHTRVPGFAGGFIGVDVFFVLSGYLITGILLREAETTGEIALGRFLLRRAARLYPALLLMITAVLVIGPFFWPEKDLWVAALIAGLYLADYVCALFGGVFVLGHTWSLAVEEHFYLLWPLAMIGLARLDLPARRKALVVAFLAATLWRLANALYFLDFPMSAYRFDTRLSGLVLGAWLAVAGLKLRPSAASASGCASLAALAFLTLSPRSRQCQRHYCNPPLISLAWASSRRLPIPAQASGGFSPSSLWPGSASSPIRSISGTFQSRRLPDCTLKIGSSSL